MNNVANRVKNHFIPNTENDYKPLVLRPRIIAFVCMVALVGEFGFVFGTRYVIPHVKLFGIVEANTLVDETNQNRVQNNLPSLAVSPLLQAAAQEKANDMASKGYFAHTSPQGVTPWFWFENVGYQFDYAGENLAVNFSDSQDVTNAWMNSTEHRANILSGDFTQIGIATAQGIYNGSPATYVVEEFGTPAPVAAAPVEFVNTAVAASVPTSAPMPQVAVAPATTKAAAAKTLTKIALAKPVVKTTPVVTKPVTVIPVIVAIQNSTDTNSEQTFVAVQGAQAEVTSSASIPAQVTTTVQLAPVATSVVPTGAVAPAASAIGLTQPEQSNWVQKIFSNPLAVVNDFYTFLIILFGLALVLNIFIKIRIQFPRLIASGVVVIVISGLCIMLNQNIGLLHAAVL